MQQRKQKQEQYYNDYSNSNKSNYKNHSNNKKNRKKYQQITETIMVGIKSKRILLAIRTQKDDAVAKEEDGRKTRASNNVV